MKGERGDLRRPEGEGGRSRAAEAGRRGGGEEGEGGRRWGGGREGGAGDRGAEMIFRVWEVGGDPKIGGGGCLNRHRGS